MSAKAVLLPKGEDPDTFLKKGNLEEFGKRLYRALPLIDFFFEWLMKTHPVSPIDGKVNLAKEGIAMIRRIPDRIRRDFYVRALAEQLDIKEAILYEMIQSSPKERPPSVEALKKKPPEPSAPKSEEMVVRLMVHHPELIPAISREKILDEFESPLLKRLGKELEALFQKRGTLNLTDAMGSFDEGLKKRLLEYTFQESSVGGDQQKQILKDCIEKVFEFPEGIGKVECVNVEHEEVLLIPRWINCNRVTFKYGLGDKFISVLKTLKLLGLDNKHPIEVKAMCL